MPQRTIDLSVIITITEQQWYDNIAEIYQQYKKSIEASGLSYEFIYVTDSDSTKVLKELAELNNKGERISIVKLGRWFGDATAVNLGFEQSCGKYILTLPTYMQIAEEELARILDKAGSYDMIIAQRKKRLDHQIKSRIFHKMVKKIVGQEFHDLGCKVRLLKREVLENIYIYGDQSRFLPLIATKNGYKIHEIPVTAFQSEKFHKSYFLGHFIQRFVDLISIFFLIKFTKKPLRFFGFPGIISFSLGTVLALYLFIVRAFFNVPLADKPIVLVSILLIIFGVQLFAIGLVAEIIIFTHSKESKDYVIESIYHADTVQEADHIVS